MEFTGIQGTLGCVVVLFHGYALLVIPGADAPVSVL
jgi:hypothetical protein